MPLAIQSHRGEGGDETTFLNDIERNSMYHGVTFLGFTVSGRLQSRTESGWHSGGRRFDPDRLHQVSQWFMGN